MTGNGVRCWKCISDGISYGLARITLRNMDLPVLPIEFRCRHKFALLDDGRSEEFREFGTARDPFVGTVRLQRVRRGTSAKMRRPQKTLRCQFGGSFLGRVHCPRVARPDRFIEFAGCAAAIAETW
jgi:hypothetical protein